MKYFYYLNETCGIKSKINIEYTHVDIYWHQGQNQANDAASGWMDKTT